MRPSGAIRSVCGLRLATDIEPQFPTYSTGLHEKNIYLLAVTGNGATGPGAN